MRALGLLALLALVGCSATPVETSDVRPVGDTLYLGALHRNGHAGMDDPEVRESTLRVGRAVCDVIDLGDSPRDAYLLMISSGSSPVAANLIVETAITHLCPDTYPAM